MKKSDLEDAARIIRDNKTFLIAGHVGPDGDCMGCMCASALALESMHKSAFPVVSDGVPELYKFLPGSEMVLNAPPSGQHFDVALVVDSDRPDRLGELSETLSLCDHVLAIDHHPGDGWPFGTQVIDPTRASCGEIVYELLLETGAYIGPEIADCLLTAMITDTGSFRYSNVKPITLRTAAALLEHGASPDRVSQKVFESRSLPSVKVLGKALEHLTVTDDGLISYTFVTRADMEETRASDSDTDGVVNYARSIRGSRAGILFRETADGSTRVSLRTSSEKDISRIARLFGGGGHRAAAGCTLEHPLPEAIDLVLEAVKTWMAS